jgi:hypothetical protein
MNETPTQTPITPPVEVVTVAAAAVGCPAEAAPIRTTSPAPMATAELTVMGTCRMAPPLYGWPPSRVHRAQSIGSCSK